MPVIDLILPAACLVYVLAAASDVAARIIPDSCSLALLLLGLLRLLLLIDGSASALVDVATAAGTFAVLVMLCMAGLLGGGDAKLIAASTFFLGFERLADFFSATALSGGALALLYLIGHALLSGRTLHLPPPRNGRRHGLGRRLKVVLAAEYRRVARKQSIPYGVAIAAGAVLSLGGLH